MMINLLLSNIDDLDHYKKQIKDTIGNSQVYVTIEEVKEKDIYRKQYFAKLTPLAKKAGYTQAEVHDLIKKLLLPNVINNKEYLIEDPIKDSNGEILNSTKNLNKFGFAKLLRSTEKYFFNKMDTII